MFKALSIVVFAVSACGGDGMMAPPPAACAARSGSYSVAYTQPEPAAPCPFYPNDIELAGAGPMMPTDGQCTLDKVSSPDNCSSDFQLTCTDGSRANAHSTWSADGRAGQLLLVLTLSNGAQCSYTATATKL